jgi:hypothetical protein
MRMTSREETSKRGKESVYTIQNNINIGGRGKKEETPVVVIPVEEVKKEVHERPSEGK